MQTVNSVKTSNFVMQGYLYMHRAIRADISNLLSTSARIGNLSAEEARRLQNWFNFYWEMLEGHHKEEDSDFFPGIAARDATFKEKICYRTEKEF
jgi:hypothetical protein